MNILFFLKPKSEVAFIYDHSTLRQVLETMEFHKYASIPMLNPLGNQEIYSPECKRSRNDFYSELPAKG